MSALLELEPARELHASWFVVGAPVYTQGCIVSERVADVVCVEADAVGDVEDFPGKMEEHAVVHMDHLVQTGVDVKVTVATELVALTCFAWVRFTQSSGGSGLAIK